MKTQNTINEIINILGPLSKPENLEGMQRYGIRFEKAYGINIPVLRNLAKKYKPNHELALELWETKIHELQLLAIFIDDYKKVDKSQMNKWVKDFASWDICDQCCSNLFGKTPFAYEKAFQWSKSKKEFIKRAGFVLPIAISVHDKKMEDEKFIKFFPMIEREANDERNFVRKAVNWLLRQIGKRNLNLNKKAIRLAEKIKMQNSKSAKWIASDAIRELTEKSKMMKK